MVKSVLTFFDSKEETGILAVLLMLLGTQSRHLRKRLKGTFGVMVRRAGGRWINLGRLPGRGEFLQESKVLRNLKGKGDIEK